METSKDNEGGGCGNVYDEQQLEVSRSENTEANSDGAGVQPTTLEAMYVKLIRAHVRFVATDHSPEAEAELASALTDLSYVFLPPLPEPIPKKPQEKMFYMKFNIKTINDRGLIEIEGPYHSVIAAENSEEAFAKLRTQERETLSKKVDVLNWHSN